MSFLTSPQPLAAPARPRTDYQWLSPAEEPLYEVIDGRRVELLPMSTNVNSLKSKLHLEIGFYARECRNGRAYVEMLYHIDRARNQQRRLDVTGPSSPL